MKKKLMNHSIALFLAFFMLVMIMPSPVKADSVLSQELRQRQEAILRWKNEGNETKILTGELLDGAGNSASDWYAFSIGRMGLEERQDAYLSRLQEAVVKIYEDLDKNMQGMKVTDWNRIALTVAACGGDPTRFGKDSNGNSINLIKDGVWDCIFDDPGRQGLNGYIWSLIVLDSGDYEIPGDAKWTRDKLVDKILDSQKEDGGFGLKKGEKSDVDMTAMALTALAPYKEKAGAEAENAFSYLSGMQQIDGTMAIDSERTSESTGWTMIALCSWGKNPFLDEQFIKDGNTLYDGYKQFLLDNGSVIHSLDGQEQENDGNSMSGYQALYALEACIRRLEEKNNLFYTTDAVKISEERIEKAGENLPKLENKMEKDKEQVVEETKKRSDILTIGIVGIGAILVIILGIGIKKKKQDKTVDRTSYEDDDEW